MRGDLVGTRSLSRLDLARWRELAARAVAPNPFFEPEYVLPLARALGQEGDVRLLIVRDGAEWKACLPVQVAARWHRIPLCSLATWRGFYLFSPLGSPLVSPDRSAEALAVLLDGIRPSGSRARFGALELVAEDRGLAEPLAEALAGLSPAPLLFDRVERAAVRRRAEHTFVQERLGPSTRKNLRRLRRKLGEDLGEEPEIVDCSGEAAAYPRFVALEAAGWKGAQGTAIGSVPGHALFFEEMCRAFAELGRLQVFELRGAGKPLAMACNLRGGDTDFLFKQAFDESWSPYSPGMLLETELLGRFYESDASFIDSCANRNNPMFNRLLPDRRPLATYALPAPGVSGRAIRSALATARYVRARQRARRVVASRAGPQPRERRRNSRPARSESPGKRRSFWFEPLE